MPVLSTQAWRLSQQRLTEEEQIQLHKELETCIEVAGTIRNSVESYMTEKAIRHIEELDYPYRQDLIGSNAMQSEKKQIHCWEETRRYYMKIKYGFFYIIQIRK